jgi:hypothetical protein
MVAVLVVVVIAEAAIIGACLAVIEHLDLNR